VSGVERGEGVCQSLQQIVISHLFRDLVMFLQTASFFGIGLDIDTYFAIRTTIICLFMSVLLLAVNLVGFSLPKSAAGRISVRPAPPSRSGGYVGFMDGGGSMDHLPGHATRQRFRT